LSFASSSA
jgi:hypothetical protein